MHDEQRGVIYKATNLINGKSYIGLTTKTLKHRKNEHLNESRKPRKGKCNVYFYNAIRKYGEDNFKWEVIEVAPKIKIKKEYEEYLCKREIYWIEFYDSYNNGYNSTKGGEGVTGVIWTEEQRRKASERGKGRIFTLETRMKISESNKGRKFSEEHKSKISENHHKVNGVNNPMFGNTHSIETRNKISDARKGNYTGANNNSAKAVVQLSIKGEFIAEYSYAREFGELTGRSNISHITSCCKGNRKTAYGFKWIYKDDYQDYIEGESKFHKLRDPKESKTFPIVQLTIDGEYVAEHISATEYARSIGRDIASAIIKVCKGKQKTSCGFKWMYKYDYEKLEEEAI